MVTTETHVDKAAAWDELAKTNAEIARLTHEIESYRFALSYISLNVGCDAQAIAQQTLDANLEQRERPCSDNK